MNVVVSAGGTGGDLFPAVAVVEQLSQLLGSRLAAEFVGSPTRIESRIVPSLGYGFTPIPVTGFKGLMHRSTFALPWRIFRSEQIVGSLLKRVYPAGMICGGTYISFPAARAAFKRNIPVMLIEPNVMPGKTNRLLARKATKIIAAFEELKECFSQEIQRKIVVTGNPTRQSLSLSLPEQKSARLSLSLKPDIFTVFVFGGSLGAKALNTAVERVLPQIIGTEIQIIWQTGANYTPPDNLPQNVVAFNFIDDMAASYSAADLVVCRAGGGTVAELGNVGKPAILVPLPSASNNEQYFNARAMETAEAGLIVSNADIAARLMPLLYDFINNKTKLTAMTVAAARLARPNAARRAAEEFLTMISDCV